MQQPTKNNALVPATGLTKLLGWLKGKNILVYKCRFHGIRYTPKPLSDYLFPFSVELPKDDTCALAVDFSYHWYPALENLCDQCGCKCLCELFDGMVDLLEEALRIRMDGDRVVAINHHTGERRVLVMPPFLPE